MSYQGSPVQAKRRLRAAPDLPTVDEAGLPGFYMTAWEAIWVPSGTPKAVIDRLNAAVVDALATPAVALRLTEMGQEIFSALAALHKAELAKWWPIIKAANIRAE